MVSLKTDTTTPRGKWCEAIMPWGKKHSGKRLDELQEKHLEWLISDYLPKQEKKREQGREVSYPDFLDALAEYRQLKHGGTNDAGGNSGP